MARWGWSELQLPTVKAYAELKQLDNSESLPEDDSRPDLEPNPDPEPELPSFNQAISRKVSRTFILPFIYEN